MTGSYVVILAIAIGVGAPFLLATVLYFRQRRAERASRARREDRSDGWGGDGNGGGGGIDRGSHSKGDDGDRYSGGGDGGGDGGGGGGD